MNRWTPATYNDQAGWIAKYGHAWLFKYTDDDADTFVNYFIACEFAKGDGMHDANADVLIDPSIKAEVRDYDDAKIIAELARLDADPPLCDGERKLNHIRLDKAITHPCVCDWTRVAVATDGSPVLRKVVINENQGGCWWTERFANGVRGDEDDYLLAYTFMPEHGLIRVSGHVQLAQFTLRQHLYSGKWEKTWETDDIDEVPYWISHRLKKEMVDLMNSPELLTLWNTEPTPPPAKKPRMSSSGSSSG